MISPFLKPSKHNPKKGKKWEQNCKNQTLHIQTTIHGAGRHFSHTWGEQQLPTAVGGRIQRLLWLLKNLPFNDEKWPLKCNLLEAKAIKPSSEIQHHKSKKASKFDFVLTSQNTNLWKTSFSKNFIPNAHSAYVHVSK